MEFLIVIGVIGSIAFIVWLNNRLSDLREKAERYVRLKPRLDNLDNYSRELESKESRLKSKQIEWERKVQYDIQSIQTLA
ncbi:unnamed protein product, partial [marine sediment metagenome]